MSRTLFLLMASCGCQLVSAQAQFDLNPVSVTAARLPQKVNETGRNITVLDGTMLQQLPVMSLDELLKYVPGVEVQSRGPMGAQSDIVLRGGTYQQVLILLDGIKINDPITGHFNSYMPVAPYEIARIEVLRGPAAATYGAEAVGGVIHIITKTFSQFTDTNSRHAQVNLSGGQYQMLHADAGAQYTSQSMNASLGVLSNNTSGQLLRGSNRGYLHNNTISASFAWKLPKNWQLSLRSSIDSRDFAAQNFYTTYVSDTATEKVSTLWNQLQFKQQGQKGSQEIDVVYKMTTDHYVYNPFAVANDNHSRYGIVQYINTHQFGSSWHSSFGAQVSERSILSNDRGDHNTLQLAAFGTVLYQIKHWRMSGSLRSDWDQNYGFALLPQINAAYVANKITFRSNVGRAIRSADFTERFNNYNKALVSAGSIGNPDLGAEKSWNYELGATANLGKYCKANATGFYRSQHDAIDWVNTAYAVMPRQVNLVSTGSYALAKNIKDVTTKGVELDLSYQRNFAQHHQLFLQAGITLLQSKSNDSVPSYYIIAHAKTLVQGTLLYGFKKINCSLNILFKERAVSSAPGIQASISPQYCILNARLGMQINRHWSVFAQCTNLTGVHYSDLLGSQMPGRWLSAGGRFWF
jgi:vitamin B12 transporter